MKMRVNLIIAAFILFIISSCKESDRDEDKTFHTSTDVAFSTNLVYDIFKTFYQAANYTQGIVTNNTTDSISVYGCDTIFKDTTSNPKWLKIQFNSGCTSEGITRSGKIYSTFDSYFDITGATATLILDDFNYGAFKVYYGTITIKNEGLIDSIPNYTIQFNEVKIINNFSQRINYSGTHQLKIIQGGNTQTIVDDIYSITGSNSGRVFKGNGFTSQIITALNLNGNCNWICSGVVTVKPENIPTRTLDFGSGCDKSISITVYETKNNVEIP